ncbi:MAG: META domain-containing protein [Saprospiraceae bacterium]|nr:META domain-containing protein [Lewinella sp.]
MKKINFLIVALALLILGCSPKMQEDTLSEKEATGMTPSYPPASESQMGQDWENNKTAGIPFIVTGNEPFWSVEIDFDSLMIFSTMEEKGKLKTPVPQPVSPQDVAALSYRAETESGILQVTIFPQTCTDDMSGIEYPYRVRVTTQIGKDGKMEEYTGCGRFRGDYRLQDIWALTTIDGDALDPAEFPKGVPTMDLQLTNGKVYGLAGCNQYRGTVNAQHDMLFFGNLMSTKMACPVLMFENQFTAAISGKGLNYELKDGQLILSNEDHRLIFKKVD